MYNLNANPCDGATQCGVACLNFSFIQRQEPNSTNALKSTPPRLHDTFYIRKCVYLVLIRTPLRAGCTWRPGIGLTLVGALG
jgi:hypothetical protein